MEFKFNYWKVLAYCICAWLGISSIHAQSHNRTEFQTKSLTVQSSLHSTKKLKPNEAVEKLQKINSQFNGIIEGEVWLLTEISIKDSGIYTFEIPNASIDTVIAWHLEENQANLPILVGGDHYPSSQQLGGISSPFRHVFLGTGEHKFLIKYIQKGRYPHALFLLHPQKVFQKKKTNQFIINGIFIGFCIFLCLLSVIIGIYLRKLIFVYYSIWTLLQLAYFTCSLGLLKYSFYPETPLLNSTIRAFISAIIPQFFTLLVIEQLNANEKFRRIKLLNLGILFFCIVLFLFERFNTASFWNYASLWISIVTIFSIIGTASSAIIIAVSYKNFNVNPLVISICFGLQIVITAILIVIESESMPLDFLQIFTYLGLLPLIEITAFGILIGWTLTKTLQQNNQLLKENFVLQTQSQEIYSNTLENERKRMAMELHDSSLNRISILSMLLSTKSLEKEYIQSEIAAISEEIRQTSYALYPPWMDALKFQEVLEREIAHIKKSNSLNINFSFFDWEQEPSENQKRHLLRIIQEFIQNTLKHGKADTVNLYLFQRENQFIIELEDDGIGYLTESKQTGLGSISVETRIMLMQGRLSISSKPGQGVNWMISIPIEP